MVHSLLRRAYEMLPEPGKDAVKAALKPKVELNRVIAVLNAMRRDSTQLVNIVPGVTAYPASPVDDTALTERLLRAYQIADGEGHATGASMWTDFFRSMHGNLHDTFMAGDIVASQRILRDPGKTNLFYGFDSLSRDLLAFAKSAKWREANAVGIADSIVRLAELLGAKLYPNTEAIANGYGQRETIDAATLLDSIDQALGVKLAYPAPFPDEHGLLTDRGVLSYRVFQAIYQAMRIRQITHGIARPAVLEIGAGLGRTAFYARQFGISDYTIIDLPITSLAQGSFLGRTLGEENVALLGEPETADPDRLKIMSPKSFVEGSRRYDLIINCDSLTEMSREVAAGYIDQVLPRADAFLSINHEFNPFTVRQLLYERRVMQPIVRSTYFMRNGYVEEFVNLKG